jgi:hypothetical protein
MAPRHVKGSEATCFTEAMVAHVADGPEGEQTVESQAKQAGYDTRVAGENRKAVLQPRYASWPIMTAEVERLTTECAICQHLRCFATTRVTTPEERGGACGWRTR